VSWLAGKRAVAVLSFDVDAESPILAHGRRFADHAMAMTHQAFGPLVGVPRLLELLTEYELAATFFVPGLTAERYPHMVAQIVEAGHEVGHHSYSHRSPVDLSESEERADFERALAALERLDVRPTGHRAAMWEASWRTPGLVAEYGLTYDSSLMDSDRPYRLRLADRVIAELPPHWGLDDWEQYAFLPRPAIGSVIESPRKVLELWRAELDAMRRHGCLFMLTCHPFLSGRASRVEALRALIEHALEAGDVDFATGATVAARAHADATLPERELRPVTADPGTYPDL
jgi:peptidoglycan/xylan/chitin deacetylase (PgdA/CDA1 family)